MFIHSHPILARFLIWIIFPILIVLSVVYWFLLQSLPQEEGIVNVEGLASPVKVIRDEHAIPRILAETDHDAFFTLGYLHAQERIWQMTYKKRLGQGRLSEILGIESLGIDQFMRGHGMVRAAQQSLESLDSTSRKVLEVYASGVNAWIKERNKLPVEFYILDTKPELWEPEDSILMIKLMTLALGPGHNQELDFDLLVKELGLEKASEIRPNVNSKVKSGSELNAGSFISDDLGENLIALNKQLYKKFHMGGETILGSNAWAVSGKHTKSGLPLLASDPHMGLEIPTIWYLAELIGEKLHVTGATFPGVPLVFMGRNNNVAWGVTNMMPDAVDLYIERINPLNPNQYEVEGEWVDMEIEEQLIHIKSASPSFLTDAIPPVKWQIRRTRHGPLISDAIGRVDYPLALRWTMLNHDDKTFQSFLKMNYSENLESFQSALKDYTAPAVNLIYADSKNNIAHFSAGKIPIRKNGNGRLPVPGWKSDYDWEGYIPFDSLPHRINPETGYVVNANNKTHEEDYPYIISNSWGASYRFNRIEQVIQEYIQSEKKLEVDDFVALQSDTQSLQVKELLPFIISLPAKTPNQKKAINRLKEWDGILSGDSEATAIYEVWLRHFNGLLLSDDLKGNLLHESQGDRLQLYSTQLKPGFISQIVQKSEKIKFDWCDLINTSEHESCEELGLIALNSTIDDLGRIVGFGQKWGDIFEIYYPHPVLSNIQLLDSIFSRSVEGAGDRFSVDRSDWLYSDENGYRSSLTAAYRQVIDFSDENLSGFINNTGQSGNIMSKHYDDNIDPFKQFKLWPMHLGRANQSKDELIFNLEPKQ